MGHSGNRRCCSLGAFSLQFTARVLCIGQLLGANFGYRPVTQSHIIATGSEIPLTCGGFSSVHLIWPNDPDFYVRISVIVGAPTSGFHCTTGLSDQKVIGYKVSSYWMKN